MKKLLPLAILLLALFTLTACNEETTPTPAPAPTAAPIPTAMPLPTPIPDESAFAHHLYTAPGAAQPTHVTMDILDELGFVVVQGGSQIALMYEEDFIGVSFSVMNYLATGENRIPVGIDDSFMADDDYFTQYIPLSLLVRLGFTVRVEDDRLFIGGEFDVYATQPHPFAVILQSFIDHSEGEIAATVPALNGQQALLIIETIDHFSQATAFTRIGDTVISKEFGNIDGFPFSLAYTTDGWGNLIQTTADGGNRSYTILGIADGQIAPLFTLYAETQDDGSTHFYRYNGGWQAGIDGGRYAITAEDFLGVRFTMGDTLIRWQDQPNSNEFILDWVVRP